MAEEAKPAEVESTAPAENVPVKNPITTNAVNTKITPTIIVAKGSSSAFLPFILITFPVYIYFDNYFINIYCLFFTTLFNTLLHFFDAIIV